jgi:hypothetical protein
MKQSFTQEEVIAEAKRLYGGKPICIDCLDDAMQCETIGDAASTLVLDSAMWDSPTGNPFDVLAFQGET